MHPLATSIALALTIPSLAASSAAAAKEAGDDCVANAVEANRTMIVWPSGPRVGISSALEEQAFGEEAKGGVITGWKVRVAPGQAPLPQRLELYRGLSGKEEYRQEIQTPLETVGAGESFFPVRIPVSDANLGLWGPEGTFAFSTGESAITGTFEGSANPGEVRTVTGLTGFRTPLTVAVEVDRDGDGYGDGTQDGCPEFAAIHTACPFVHLTPSVTAVTKRAIILEVSTGDPTQVRVEGQVGWSLRTKSAGRGAKRKRLVVGLSGGTQEVPAGATIPFTVPLPKAVNRRLKKLAPKEKLKARLSVIATDLVGQQTATHLMVRLPGPEIVVSKKPGP
jgi:hypothetical protein